MVKPDKAETVDHLKGWSPPVGAYVLLEAHVTHVYGQGDSEPGTRLMTLNVENRPEQVEKIIYYHNKGFKPIHYGNFPKLGSEKATRYSRGGKGNPWGALERQLLRFMDNGNAQRENEELKKALAEYKQKEESFNEVDALRAKVAKLEAANKPAPTAVVTKPAQSAEAIAK